MTDHDMIVKLANDFLTQAQHALKESHSKRKHTIWWQNPDKQGQWDIYQSGLSKARAEQLAKKLTYFLSVRWFDKNIPTRVLPDGTPIQ